MKNSQKTADRLDALIVKGTDLMSKTHRYESFGGEYVDQAMFQAFRAASLSAIESIFSRKHVYFEEFDKEVKETDLSQTKAGVEILRNIKADVENGYLQTLKDLVSADVFGDFLEMSKYLLEEGYKDPAAVIIGSTLETHLRQLAASSSIAIEVNGVPRKVSALNDDLLKLPAYNSIVHKQVIAWLDLRNKAAHGKYGEYDKNQVENMLSGVLGFMSSNPLV